MQKPLVCTISKFPPYMSGHSFEAMNQGQALFELTGYKHHELTYDPSVYDKSTYFDDSSKLKKELEKYLFVHRIKPTNKPSTRVLDGELIKAFEGKIINLIEQKGVNVLSTFYLDPHASIANQAKLYGEKVLGKKIITVHKAVGTDISISIADHIEDGQGKFLLLQLLEADLMFAVSQFAKNKIIGLSKLLLPKKAAERIVLNMKVLYAPIKNEFFRVKDLEVISKLKKQLKINPDSRVISYLGRIFPEKGLADLIQAYKLIKTTYPDITLIISGDGIELNNLKLLAKELKTPDIIFTGAISDSNEKRALMQMSYLGVIPSKPVGNIVETLCVSVLEYQASGCVLLTTRVGGVPEAGGEHSLYAKHSDPEDLAKKISQVLDNKINREEIIAKGIKHTAKFNYKDITSNFLDLVNQKLNS